VKKTFSNLSANDLPFAWTFLCVIDKNGCCISFEVDLLITLKKTCMKCQRIIDIYKRYSVNLIVLMIIELKMLIYFI